MPLNNPSRRISPLDLNNNVTIGVAFPLDRDSLQQGTQSVRDQIKSNLVNLMLTEPGERINLREYGVGLKSLLFESDVDIKNLNSIVENQIQTFLPQITLNKVTSQFLEDEHQLIIKIIYQYNLDGALDAVQLNFNK